MLKCGFEDSVFSLIWWSPAPATIAKMVLIRFSPARNAFVLLERSDHTRTWGPAYAACDFAPGIKRYFHRFVFFFIVRLKSVVGRFWCGRAIQNVLDDWHYFATLLAWTTAYQLAFRQCQILEPQDSGSLEILVKQGTHWDEFYETSLIAWKIDLDLKVKVMSMEHTFTLLLLVMKWKTLMFTRVWLCRHVSGACFEFSFDMIEKFSHIIRVGFELLNIMMKFASHSKYDRIYNGMHISWVVEIWKRNVYNGRK